MLIGFIRNEAALMLLAGRAGAASNRRTLPGTQMQLRCRTCHLFRAVTCSQHPTVATPACAHLSGRLLNTDANVTMSLLPDDAIQDVSELRPLPEPMIEGNYDGNSYCMRGNAFRKAVIEHEVRLHVGLSRRRHHVKQKSVEPTRSSLADGSTWGCHKH